MHHFVEKGSFAFKILLHFGRKLLVRSRLFYGKTYSCKSYSLISQTILSTYPVKLIICRIPEPLITIDYHFHGTNKQFSLGHYWQLVSVIIEPGGKVIASTFKNFGFYN